MIGWEYVRGDWRELGKWSYKDSFASTNRMYNAHATNIPFRASLLICRLANFSFSASNPWQKKKTQ